MQLINVAKRISFMTLFLNVKKRKVFRKHSCYHCQRIAHTAQDLPAKEYENEELKTNTYIMKQCHIHMKRG